MVERSDFAAVMAFLATACGVKIRTPDEQADFARQTEVYYDLLADLPLATLQAAAKRTALAHRYPSLPPAGAIRSEARTLERASVAGPVAWEMVVRAIRQYGRRRPTAGLGSLPAEVARAARLVGWEVLCDAPREGTLVRHQFLATYDQIQAGADREAELPAALRGLARGVGELPAGAPDVPRSKLQLPSGGD